MKKLLTIAMALFFLGATSSLVLADDAAAPATTPVAKVMKKKSHKGMKHKGKKKAAKAATTDATPVAK